MSSQRGFIPLVQIFLVKTLWSSQGLNWKNNNNNNSSRYCYTRYFLPYSVFWCPKLVLFLKGLLHSWSYFIYIILCSRKDLLCLFLLSRKLRFRENQTFKQSHRTCKLQSQDFFLPFRSHQRTLMPQWSHGRNWKSVSQVRWRWREIYERGFTHSILILK